MPRILVNDRVEVNGQLMVATGINEDKDTGREKTYISGQFITHQNYEVITSLESERYYVEGITIIKRVYDANDFNIVYEFEADGFEVKGGLSNLDIDLIDKIESEAYSEDYDRQLDKLEEEIEGVEEGD